MLGDKQKNYSSQREVKKRIHGLRRMLVLLIVFGFGLFFGGNTPSVLWLGYCVSLVLWFVSYDFALEDKRRLENKKRVALESARTTQK